MASARYRMELPPEAHMREGNGHIQKPEAHSRQAAAKVVSLSLEEFLGRKSGSKGHLCTSIFRMAISMESYETLSKHLQPRDKQCGVNIFLRLTAIRWTKWQRRPRQLAHNSKNPLILPPLSLGYIAPLPLRWHPLPTIRAPLQSRVLASVTGIRSRQPSSPTPSLVRLATFPSMQDGQKTRSRLRDEHPRLPMHLGIVVPPWVW